MKNKFILFLIFFTLILGILGFWYYQRNIYSKEILKLDILGPTEVSLDQEIEYVVKFKNNGDFRLEEPELIFVAPLNSMADDKIFERKTLNSEQLGGAIYPGEEKNFSFKIRLLGKEGEVKIARASLSYRPKNLKARYESTTSFTTVISQVPLTFEFDFPSKIEPGKEFRFRLNYFSNVDYPLANLRIKIDYPPDFEFLESTPKSLGKTEWEIGLLNRAEGGRVEVLGKISGEVGEQKFFKAKFGSWQEGEFILLKEATKGLEIVKPSIFVRQEINGNPRYIALPGEWLHYEIYFKNLGDDTLNNLSLIDKLEGEAFDFQTIKSEFGNYQAGDNSVIFDWRKVSKLQFLDPIEEGKVDFWIKLKEDFGQIKNPLIRNKIFISQVKEEFVTKIGSKLEMVQKAYYQDEIFGNSGPLPPKVGEITTYTIVWQIKNYYSDVKDVKIKAILPQNVNPVGRIFPEEMSSKFTFDTQSREIVFLIGDLERGIGVFKPGPVIGFQIAFTPNEFQRGQTPEIIGQAKITGEDSWTETILESSSPGVDTTLPDDPNVNEEQGIVQ